MDKAELIGRTLLALVLGIGAFYASWERPGTGAVWLAMAYMVWPNRTPSKALPAAPEIEGE